MPMIHIKEKGERIPFDIAGIRAFDYDLTDLDAVAEVKDRLEQTIKSFNITERQEDETVAEDVQPDDTSNTHSSQLLPILYEIQDQIAQLKDEIHNKETETIQAVVRAAQPVMPVEDTNTALMKALLPDLIKNPALMKNLMQLGEMTKNSGK